VIQPIGLTRLLGLRPPVPVQHLAPEVQQEMKALGFRSTASHALSEEAAAYETILAEAMGAAPLRQDLPVAVVSRGQVEGPPDQDAGGKAANADLARRFVHGRLVVAEGSGHFIPLDRPDLVIEAVAQIVDVIRGGA
jgi:pimeloyl-ACP methyl ester carboxylesterase